MTLAAPQLARRIADALEEAAVPYALGGALALGVWGFPRATNDVDLNVFVPLEDLSGVLDVLERAGCALDRQAALRSASERGDFRTRVEGMRIDVFVPCIDLYESARKRIRQAPLEGRPACFLSPEDLAVFKLLFFRTKDILDVERLAAFLGAELDRAYVRRWLVDIVGEGDERIERWDRILDDILTLEGA
ncbi:MAG: hypothetical protein JXR96_07155 [Deltaproteobacteria bacterium]|nr:hypothetical protein [Deltaproteobacteria bacterium]